MRDERDFEEYAEEKRARAREERLSTAREGAAEAYEKKEEPEKTRFEWRHPKLAVTLRSITRNNPTITTRELINKLQEPVFRQRFLYLQQANGRLYSAPNTIGMYLDDIETMGIHLDAEAVMDRMSRDAIALNADMLKKHGAEFDINDMVGALSDLKIMKNYEMLHRHGYGVDPKTGKTTIDLKDCVKKVFDKEGGKPIVENLDYLLENGMTIGQVVRILDAEAIAENYEVLKAYGAKVVNPLAHIKVSKKKKKPQERSDYMPGFIEPEDGPGGYPDWMLKK